MQNIKTTVLSPKEIEQMLAAEYGERLAPVDQAKLAKQAAQRAGRMKDRPQPSLPQ